MRTILPKTSVAVVAVVAVAALAAVVARDVLRVRIPPRVVPAAGRYVALGDSYSAGSGVAPLAEAGDPSCGRSLRAFPMLLGARVVADREVLACAGATIADVLGPTAVFSEARRPWATAQVDGLTRDVDLVTITIGGNDLDFAPALRFCALRSGCAHDPYGGAPTLNAWVAETLGRIRADLARLFARVRELAPRAHVLALGYPALFPPGDLDAPGVGRCDVVELAFDAEERDAIRRWGGALNAAIRSEAEAAGVAYLGLDRVFAGHEVCAATEPWIEPVVFDPDLATGSFHPNAAGHVAIARAVRSAYAG